jgi:hypothetical protein
VLRYRAIAFGNMRESLSVQMEARSDEKEGSAKYCQAL